MHNILHPNKTVIIHMGVKIRFINNALDKGVKKYYLAFDKAINNS